MSRLTIDFRGGAVFLPKLGLWLDPHRAQRGPERVLVSHAHSDHTGAHREVILTAATARLMQARLGGRRRPVEHLLTFGEAQSFEGPAGAFRVTLLPAGHVLGSAMAWVEAGGERLLYTGDFKLRPSHSCEAASLAGVASCDLLIMETTFGLPKYRFPPADQVTAAIVEFCREALQADQTPLLLAYSLGKSQETLGRLAGAGLPLRLHRQVATMTRIYEEFGRTFPAYDVDSGEAAKGRVLIAPPGGTRPSGGVRTAILTGWAMDPATRFRSRTDAAIPLSDHADFDELLQLVEAVRPRRVFTVHGFAVEFALELRRRGWDAAALGRAEQLELPLDGAASEDRPGTPEGGNTA